jgi:hypothetical protein
LNGGTAATQVTAGHSAGHSLHGILGTKPEAFTYSEARKKTFNQPLGLFLDFSALSNAQKL